MPLPPLVRIVVAAVVVAVVVSCGSGPQGDELRTAASGQDDQSPLIPSSSVPPGPEVVPPTKAEPDPGAAAAEREADPGAPAAGGAAGAGTEPPMGADDSPVSELTAAQLQAAVTAPSVAARRSVAGPSLDQVALADGTTLWRVRVPGGFQVRAARVTVAVGARSLGYAVVTADLDALVAVTPDGSGLDAGAPVTYQWEGGPVVAAGKLVVVR